MQKKTNLSLIPKPFIKWVGGKSRVLSQLFIFLPEKFDRYFEPFVGGGSFLFSLNPEKAFINDTNKTLINTYKIIKEDPNKLIELLENTEKNYLNTSEEERKGIFLSFRERFNDPKIGSNEKAALFIFLNKTCFNGMYRENSKGIFNVPFGKYKNPKILDKENLLKLSAFLKKVELSSISFEKSITKAKKGDFIYFDPPYYPLNKTSSFTSYTQDNFAELDQVKLKSVFEYLDSKGCKVMLSNSNTKFIRDLYKDYRIEKIFAARSINSKGQNRGKIEEVVVLNY